MDSTSVEDIQMVLECKKFRFVLVEHLFEVLWVESRFVVLWNSGADLGMGLKRCWSNIVCVFTVVD